MLKIFLLSILIIVITASPDPFFISKIGPADNTNSSYKDFLLPTTTIPSRYQLDLDVPSATLTGDDTSYTGSVIITLQVTESTGAIFLHSNVTIRNISISSLNNVNGQILVKNHTTNVTTQIAVILLESNLTANINYNLRIAFNGTLETETMQGFYRSEYVSNSVKEYLGTTQFEATYARKAFPCFDEPQYKATFVLTITHPSDFTAISNTPAMSTAITTSKTVTKFYETPQMSTYLLAFVVSKFSCGSNENNGIPFRVCTRPEFVNDVSDALEYGNKILAALDTWTDFFYNSTTIGKMDQFAIPDFNAGAMENWGLVTYREYLTLYNSNYTSNKYLQSMITVIAHEFAHMWFGNLLTTKWWDTTFLNEGFATYFEYFIVNQISGLEKYQLDKQFILEEQRTALVADASLTSQPLTSEAWTQSQISNKFDVISYNKGSSILVMIENLVGTTTFQSALRQYIKNNAYKSVTPDLLWTVFDNIDVNGMLPEKLTFSQFIDNWANKAGYPVVSVSLRGDNVVLTQNRFLYNGNDSTKWHIPITYITSENKNSTFNTSWLQPDVSVTINSVAKNKNWVIVNHNSKGYYRVHYDDKLFNRILLALQSNYRQITDMNRAQIIDDTFNLARANYIKYSEAFKLLNYLKNETCYYPWSAAISGLNYLIVRFGNESAMGKMLNDKLLNLIDNVSANVSYTNWTSTDPITALKLQTVWTAACRSGQKSCILEARKLFQEFKDNDNSFSIHPNIRDIVYCNGLRYSTDILNDFGFLWSRLQIFDQAHENLYILRSLGCATNKELLTFLLYQSWRPDSGIRKQDFNIVWSSIYTTSSIGLDTAFECFTSNHTTILKYYPDAIALLPNIVNRFTTDSQISKLGKFINSLEANSTLRAVAEASLTLAKENLQWQSRVHDDLDKYFNKNSANRHVLSFGSILVLILTILII